MDEDYAGEAVTSTGGSQPSQPLWFVTSSTVIVSPSTVMMSRQRPHPDDGYSGGALPTGPDQHIGRNRFEVPQFVLQNLHRVHNDVEHVGEVAAAF